MCCVCVLCIHQILLEYVLQENSTSIVIVTYFWVGIVSKMSKYIYIIIVLKLVC